MTLLISRSMLAIDSINIGVDSNILKVRDLRKSIFNHLTSMVDLDFQGQTISFKFVSFSRSIIIVTLPVSGFLSSSTSIMLKSI